MVGLGQAPSFPEDREQWPLYLFLLCLHTPPNHKLRGFVIHLPMESHIKHTTTLLTYIPRSPPHHESGLGTLPTASQCLCLRGPKLSLVRFFFPRDVGGGVEVRRLGI